MAQPDPTVTRPLSAEEEQVFKGLGIEPGFWVPLLALPLILAARRRTELAASRMTLEMASLFLERLRGLAKHCGFTSFLYSTASSSVASVSVVEKLISSCGPTGESEPLKQASALLAWHLTSDYDAKPRADVVRILLGMPLNHDWAKTNERELQDATQQLQARIDAYLPCEKFQVVPEAWKNEGFTKREVARRLLEALLAGDLLNVPSMKQSIRSKAEVLRRFSTKSIHELLIACLAGLPYEMREDLYRSMRRSIENRDGAVDGGFQGSNLATLGLSVDAFDERVDKLRAEVARSRFAHRGGKPGAAAAPKNADPAAGTARAGTFVVIHARTGGASSGSIPVRRVPDEPRTPAAPSPVKEVIPPAEPLEVIPAKKASTITWKQALTDARAFCVSDARSLLDQPLLFEDHFIKDKRVVHLGDQKKVPKSLWFVGDLHSDLLALACAWEFIVSKSKESSFEPHVLFLGDFFDRGVFNHETLLYLFRLIRDNPGRIGVVPGNHDEISWDETSGRFVSEVSPADYIDELNKILERGVVAGSVDQDRIDLGKIAFDFFKKRPRAVFFPDGLLAAHAGFPHNDLLPRLKKREDLGEPECLQDFLWLRASETAPRKRPNRSTKGCEFGSENFAEFCRLATKDLGVETRRLIRGHDHPPERYLAYPKYQVNPIVTLNTMCRRLVDESSSRVVQFPRACVGHYVPGKLPEIHQLLIPEAEIRAAYFPEPAPSRPLATEDAGPFPGGVEARR